MGEERPWGKEHEGPREKKKVSGTLSTSTVSKQIFKSKSVSSNQLEVVYLYGALGIQVVGYNVTVHYFYRHVRKKIIAYIG